VNGDPEGANPSKPQILMTGLAFPEAPRWHDGRLWFSDWGASKLIALEPEGGKEVVAEVRAFPFCTDWLPDGRLLTTAGQKVLRVEQNGSLTTYADLSGLSSHGWNELVIDGRGNAYVNGGSDGFAGEPGFVVLVTPDGSARQVADGLEFPNGMAITPDASTLIVAESYGKRLIAFDIASDSSLSNRQVWAEIDGHPDGMCLDAEGAVWTTSGPRCVRVREGGEVLETIDLELFCTSCVLGGPDKKALFMTVLDWRGDATLAEIGQVYKALEAGLPVEWPGKRTGQILAARVSG